MSEYKILLIFITKYNKAPALSYSLSEGGQYAVKAQGSDRKSHINLSRLHLRVYFLNLWHSLQDQTTTEQHTPFLLESIREMRLLIFLGGSFWWA